MVVLLGVLRRDRVRGERTARHGSRTGAHTGCCEPGFAEARGCFEAFNNCTHTVAREKFRVDGGGPRAQEEGPRTWAGCARGNDFVHRCADSFPDIGRVAVCAQHFLELSVD